MPTVRVISPETQAEREARGETGKPRRSHGTRVFLGDKELQEVGDITMHWPVHGVVTLHCSLFPSQVQEIIEDVDVHIELRCTPGYQIIQDQLPDGRWRYRCEADKSC